MCFFLEPQYEDAGVDYEVVDEVVLQDEQDGEEVQDQGEVQEAAENEGDHHRPPLLLTPVPADMHRRLLETSQNSIGHMSFGESRCYTVLTGQ
jgi:hypothetical protein